MLILLSFAIRQGGGHLEGSEDAKGENILPEFGHNRLLKEKEKAPS